MLSDLCFVWEPVSVLVRIVNKMAQIVLLWLAWNMFTFYAEEVCVDVWTLLHFLTGHQRKQHYHVGGLGESMREQGSADGEEDRPTPFLPFVTPFFLVCCFERGNVSLCLWITRCLISIDMGVCFFWLLILWINQSFLVFWVCAFQYMTESDHHTTGRWLKVCSNVQLDISMALFLTRWIMTIISGDHGIHISLNFTCSSSSISLGANKQDIHMDVFWYTTKDRCSNSKKK